VIGQSNPRLRRSWDLETGFPAGIQALGNKVYVGNLPFSVTEDELRTAFEAHGAIASVNVIMDRETGRPRGFAFVEMEDSSGAENAIRALDGTDMGGRSLRVNEAQDKRGGGGGGGGGGRGRY
jgi:RNA recognition motif-containing protein